MKNKVYIVQSDIGDSNNNYVDILNTIKLKNECHVVGLRPFEQHITGLELAIDHHPEAQYIIKGDTGLINKIYNAQDISELNPNLSKIVLNHGSEILAQLKSAIFYNENFNFKNIINKDLPLLNSSAIIMPYEYACRQTIKHGSFIRPVSNLKEFNSIVVDVIANPALLGLTIGDVLDKNNNTITPVDVMVAPLQPIKNEYRFMVVGSKIISGSGYKIGNPQQSKNIDDLSVADNKYVYDIAANYAKLYNPSDIFFMDIAELDVPTRTTNISDKYKIVEYNTFSCSGLYKTDLSKIVSAINEYDFDVDYRNNYTIKKGFTTR